MIPIVVASSFVMLFACSSPQTVSQDPVSLHDDQLPIYHRVNMDKFHSLHGFPHTLRLALSMESFPKPQYESEAESSEIIYHKQTAEGMRSYPVTSYRSELDALIELWQPSMYFVLNGPVSIASETSTVMAGVAGEQLDGSELEMGAYIAPTDAIWSGLILVSGEGTLVIDSPYGMMDVEIGALTLIVVRDALDDPLALTTCTTCQVVCSPSPPFYACCRFKQGDTCAHCFCYNSQQPPQEGCNAGGPGASACSVSDAGGPE